jgi:hypothetical protein
VNKESTMNRSNCGRLALALAIAGLAALIAPSPAPGAGGTYTVLQCDPRNRAHADAIQAGDGAYDETAYCAEPSHENSMQIRNTAATSRYKSGLWRWSTVGAGPISIVGVHVAAKLRSDNGHHARIYLADSKVHQTVGIANGDGNNAHWTGYHWAGKPQTQFVAQLGCETNGCAKSDVAKTWVRSVALTLRDMSDPVLHGPSGSLVTGGWLRGTQSLQGEASDTGSGLTALAATVNGAAVAIAGGNCERIPGTQYATALVPCPHAGGGLSVGGAVNTGASPFRDGTNALFVCAADFAGNRTCQSRTVHVDNTPPSLAFARSRSKRDPELIRAPVSDAASGVARGQILFRAVGATEWRPLPTRLEAGELRARVDSSAYPRGRYEFVASASDVAGNQTLATTRTNGAPMVLAFPLTTGAHLRVHLKPGGGKKVRLPYGGRARLAGRLTTAKGRPLAGRRIVVRERYAPGAVVRHRALVGKTDRKGRWWARLEPGPTRTVTAAFPGNPRYRPALVHAGRVVVRSKATFKTSRGRVAEGKSVQFFGHVGHRGARIPGGGKLVELQVREGTGGWNTVREALHTNSKGAFRLRYRFGSFYRSNVKYRFRVKIDREQDWPYRAPVRSRQREVTVIAH